MLHLALFLHWRFIPCWTGSLFHRIRHKFSYQQIPGKTIEEIHVKAGCKGECNHRESEQHQNAQAVLMD